MSGMGSGWNGRASLGEFWKGEFETPRWKDASIEDLSGDRRRLMFGY